MFEKEIQVAVDWWVTQISGETTHDNGDVRHNVFASVLASGLPPLAPAQIELFRTALTDMIRRHLMEDASERHYGEPSFGLGTDYSPDRNLGDCADLAGIQSQMLRFPCKTHMWIREDEVTVSAGYRAPTEVLYQITRYQVGFWHSETKEITVKGFTSEQKALRAAASAIQYGDGKYGAYEVPVTFRDLVRDVDQSPINALLAHESEFMHARQASVKAAIERRPERAEELNVNLAEDMEEARIVRELYKTRMAELGYDLLLRK